MSANPGDTLPAPLLMIELVPRSAWYSNVRSNVTKKKWKELSDRTAKEAGYHCQICGHSGLNQGYKWPVECHEIWNYDIESSIQSLLGLIALCPRCHEVKHFGFAELRGRKAEAQAWLQTVNQWTEREAQVHIREAFMLWETRNRIQWELNLSWLV